MFFQQQQRVSISGDVQVIWGSLALGRILEAWNPLFKHWDPGITDQCVFPNKDVWVLRSSAVKNKRSIFNHFVTITWVQYFKSWRQQQLKVVISRNYLTCFVCCEASKSGRIRLSDTLNFELLGIGCQLHVVVNFKCQTISQPLDVERWNAISWTFKDDSPVDDNSRPVDCRPNYRLACLVGREFSVRLKFCRHLPRFEV